MSIDFAIMHMHPFKKNPKLNYEKLYKDRFILVSKNDDKLEKLAINKKQKYDYINLKKIKDEKFVLLEKSQGIRQACDIMFSSQEITPNISLTTKSFETARRLASRGYAYTIIPEQYLNVFNTTEKEKYYYIDNKHNYWYSCILTNKKTYLPQISNKFLDVIRNLYVTGYAV